MTWKLTFPKMAFILGVGRKTAGQPRGRFAANFGVFIQAWGIRNDLESIWKCFSFGKIRNPRKILHGIIVEFSRKFQFPVFSTRPEVENTTLHNPKVNSLHPQSLIQIGSRVSEILQPTPKMNAILQFSWLLILRSSMTIPCQSPRKLTSFLIRSLGSNYCRLYEVLS